MKRSPAIWVMTLFFVAGWTSLSFAQGQMPTGKGIARAARTARLNRRNSATSEKDGMKVTVTMMDLSKIKTPEDLANGRVVAVVDVKGITDLPNGRYNVFVVKLNDGWQEFFESGGKIVGQAKRIEVSSPKPGERMAGPGPVIVMIPGCWGWAWCNGQLCMITPKCL